MSLSITTGLILVNVLISVSAFQKEEVFNKLCFWPTRVWHDKEYIRLLSGGFLHANWPHLLFNMMSLYFFGPYVEAYFHSLFGGIGAVVYVAFYILAVIIANLPDLYEQRHNQYFRAVGASGAVSAVIFASILFSPLNKIGLIYIPGEGISAYLFGILYLVYSAYMSKKQMDNIGHMAHFTGALFGFIFPLLFHPQLFLLFLSQILHR